MARFTDYRTFKTALGGRLLELEIGRVCEQANGQVWVRYGDSVVNVTVCAVVVGDEESLFGNHASGTAELHRNDSVADCCAFCIGIVDFTCRKLEATLFHVLLQSLVDGIYHPHSFICRSLPAACNDSQKDCEYKF